MQHFLKVHAFSALIGRAEGLNADTQYTLELAALTHDIGIRNAERRFGRCDGRLQEQEGPPEAAALLRGLGVADTTIERVCWLIAHHHTYTAIDGIDYQILVEADFLVNAYEDALSPQAAAAVYRNLFRTKAGREIFETLYGQQEEESRHDT